MKKLFLGVAIASALGLTGCSEDSYNELVDKTEPLVPQSVIVFDPGNSELPLPNDILFSGTTDGTINIPQNADPTKPSEANGDYTDPSIALGALDGWSTTAPISIKVAPATDSDGTVLTLSKTSVEQPGAVRVFEATVGGSLSSDPECKSAPNISACKIGAELQFGVDFVSTASGNQIVIVPLKPLKAKQSYIYATTNLIQDSAGRAIASSSTYTLLKLDIETKPLETPSQLLLQAAVNSYEKGMAAAGGPDAESVSYSGLFTTQSVADVYEVSKLLIAGQPGYMPEFVMPPTDSGYTLAQVLMMPPEHPAYGGASKVNVWNASLKLPVYSECSSTNCFDAEGNIAINGWWTAAYDSPVSVLSALQAGTLSQESYFAQAIANGIEDPVAALSDPAQLAGKSWLLDDGTAADKARHLTKFNPIPQIKNYEVVPVQMTVPNFAPAPATGWPTTIAMHGLGGGKEMAFAYAGTYGELGVATVAIDMPLHGARSYDANGDGTYEVSATDPSFGNVVGKPDAFINGNPLVFINIASTLTVRDNFRQATLDHLALRAALTGYAGKLAEYGMGQVFDNNQISAQGLSLGAIVGTDFATYASTGLTHPTGADLSYVYKLNAASLVAPTGGFAGTFIGSATFGPMLFDNIIQSETFMALVEEANKGPGYEPGTPEYDALVKAVYDAFLPTFAFAVQTAVDSADPINHAAMLKATGLPIHLIEIVGDGANSLPDQVLPNRVPGYPVSGTEPLIENLGLACVDTTTVGSGVVRFSKGHHSSIISPSPVEGVTDGLEDVATVEMQTEAAFFSYSAGLPDATSPTIYLGLAVGPDAAAAVVQPCI
ncbi:lipase [Shewanella gelidimarina]|uniref:VolA/Pla-1 family phospholipase n=1 Tax=Shewanella gelidimarina TaxID=56813 RepID=UPI00200DDB13|nr:VolA/Pla-1 family phospholipase [Shewanella gelidimarina]MCL1059890.1 lipase [Shewanella gelidimarina]